MANTIKYRNGGTSIEISSIDSDWSWSDTLTDAKFANGVQINYIQFNPAAANDVCTIIDGEDVDNDPPGFYSKAITDVEPRRAQYYGARMKPVLDESAGTYTAGSTVMIQLWRDEQH